MTNVAPLRLAAPAPVTRDQLSTLILAFVKTGDLEQAARLARLPLQAAAAALRGHGARAMMARALRHQLDLVAAPMALAATVALLGSNSERVRESAARSI